VLKELFQKHKTNIGHFMKFIVVGAVNFLVDYGILTLLNVVLGWPLVLSNIISYSCGVINSFLFNRYWTFKMKLKFFNSYSMRLKNRTIHPVFISFDFLKFIFVNLASLGVNTLAVYILGDLYGLPTIYAKLVATVFSFVVNFAGNKLLVFKDKPVESVQE
jgi:putative flippase GtrA